MKKSIDHSLHSTMTFSPRATRFPLRRERIRTLTTRNLEPVRGGHTSPTTGACDTTGTKCHGLS